MAAELIPASPGRAAPAAGRGALHRLLREISDLLKLRIGVIMALTAVVAMLATPGQQPGAAAMLVLFVAVVLASGAAGAFNHYYEVDLDRRMPRTCRRPFVTGYFKKGPLWLFAIGGLLIAGVGSAAWWLNSAAALHIFLGAFFYAIVYTVWLKRRSWTNIVIGGAAGSFAVLAGAAAVDPVPGPIPIALALALFLWTPSHFWSLAIAKHADYEKASVPMLPVIVGKHRAAEIVLANTLALVAISILPFFCGLGWIYLLGAVTGGGYFLYRNLLMIRDPSPRVAINSFLASLLQLILLLAGAVLDVLLSGVIPA